VVRFDPDLGPEGRDAGVFGPRRVVEELREGGLARDGARDLVLGAQPRRCPQLVLAGAALELAHALELPPQCALFRAEAQRETEEACRGFEGATAYDHAVARG
jgi:hypothetical protein